MKIRVNVSDGDLRHTKHVREILDAIARTGVKPRLTAIAKELGMPVSTVHDVWASIKKNYDLQMTLDVVKYER